MAVNPQFNSILRGLSENHRLCYKKDHFVSEKETSRNKFAENPLDLEEPLLALAGELEEHDLESLSAALMSRASAMHRSAKGFLTTDKELELKAKIYEKISSKVDRLLVERVRSAAQVITPATTTTATAISPPPTPAAVRQPPQAPTPEPTPPATDSGAGVGAPVSVGKGAPPPPPPPGGAIVLKVPLSKAYFKDEYVQQEETLGKKGETVLVPISNSEVQVRLGRGEEVKTVLAPLADPKLERNIRPLSEERLQVGITEGERYLANLEKVIASVDPLLDTIRERSVAITEAKKYEQAYATKIMTEFQKYRLLESHPKQPVTFEVKERPFLVLPDEQVDQLLEATGGKMPRELLAMTEGGRLHKRSFQMQACKENIALERENLNEVREEIAQIQADRATLLRELNDLLHEPLSMQTEEDIKVAFNEIEKNLVKKQKDIGKLEHSIKVRTDKLSGGKSEAPAEAEEEIDLGGSELLVGLREQFDWLDELVAGYDGIKTAEQMQMTTNPQGFAATLAPQNAVEPDAGLRALLGNEPITIDQALAPPGDTSSESSVE